MTGPCTGAGVGVPKAGFAAIEYIGPGAIGGALASLSGWQGAAVGAAIGAVSYELATFCPAGPPAAPTFTIADIAALLNPIGTPDKVTASAKFRDFLGAVFWPILCQCSGGTAAPVAPAPYPSGAPATLPTIGISSAACLTTSNLTSISSVTGVRFMAGLTVAAGKQHIMHAHVDTTSGGGGPFPTFTARFDYQPDSSTVPIPFGSTYTMTANHTYDIYEACPTITPGTVVLRGTYVSGANSTSMFTTLEDFCNGGPFAPNPCCPPDQSVQASLDAILGLVTLIQRQAVPFGYVPGTVHTGLTGNGTIGISGLIGVSVAVTTLPAHYGSTGTSPVEHFDLGWLTFGTADGFPSAYRLERSAQLCLPPRCSAYTQLDYDLAPGIVLTLTELLREP